jgi:hypothetical protein
MGRSSIEARLNKMGGGSTFSPSFSGSTTTKAVRMGIHNRPSRLHSASGLAKSTLITEERRSKRQIRTMKGDSIGRFETRKTYWFDFCPGNITGRTTDRTKLGSIPKVLLRKTGDSVMERVDGRGRVLGFSIMQVSRLSKQRPIEAELKTA